jgi:hypothetical protein
MELKKSCNLSNLHNNSTKKIVHAMFQLKYPLNKNIRNNTMKLFCNKVGKLLKVKLPKY